MCRLIRMIEKLGPDSYNGRAGKGSMYFDLEVNGARFKKSVD